MAIGEIGQMQVHVQRHVMVVLYYVSVIVITLHLPVVVVNVQDGDNIQLRVMHINVQ